MVESRTILEQKYFLSVTEIKLIFQMEIIGW